VPKAIKGVDYRNSSSAIDNKIGTLEGISIMHK